MPTTTTGAAIRRRRLRQRQGHQRQRPTVAPLLQALHHLLLQTVDAMGTHHRVRRMLTGPLARRLCALQR